MDGPHFPDITPIQIDPNGVVELLKNLITHKIPAYLLKEANVEIAPILTFIFQATLQQSSVPSDWKTTSIVPLFKKGNHSLPNNYRPVSLSCICSKILEHIVYLHVFAHLSKHNILCDQQHGFWQSRSCETQLIITI